MRLFALAMAVFLLVPMAAFAAGPKGDSVKREVLGLYDSAFEETPTDTMLHTNVEMPLNHLGYILRYHDLRQGPPPRELAERAVAVVTMFTYEVGDPRAFLTWLEQSADIVPRFISMGQIGANLTEANILRANRVFERLGLRIVSDYVPNFIAANVVTLDRSLIGFESQVDPLPPGHPVVVRAGEGANVALEYETDRPGGALRSIVVATGPGGGYVAGGFAQSFDEALNLKRWIIDPFEFLQRALGGPDFPVPDTTTLSGRRIYFSHVDGDAWNNLSYASIDMSKPQPSSEVMLERLIRPYPDLPVSVGIVGGDIDPEMGGGEAAAKVAKAIYALPQVEVASHTMTHPFFWEFFDPYDRERELKLIEEVSPRANGLVETLTSALKLTPSGASTHNRFVAGSNDLPRAYLRDPFSFETEIGGALKLAEGLAPAGKKAALYLWSGDTHPTETAIRATREAGVRNMNGGDVRFDTHRPSIGYVAPLSRTVGRERQIYSVNSNENNYTELWTNHFYGFRNVRETFDRTGAPRRLKGVNVYYHSYSAERPAALDAVRYHLDWARTARLTPIRASRYAAAADGFFSTEITQLSLERWTVSKRDGLDTVRFDRADERQVDMAASMGVLGSTRSQGSLYVSLDPSVADAVVALEPRRDPVEATDALHASMVDSRWLVETLKREPGRVTFRAEGFGPGDFTFENLPAEPMIVTARDGKTLIAEIEIAPKPAQPVSFSLPAGTPRPIDVSIACATSRHAERHR
ncbi:polysaccharide deacetylase family protein [Aureimonas ureilytica]|uniref:polysaccharide deacetylase family protein n=1 Tax=Aureimonas ureilytica TaxID=401562 RepID=UPI000378AEB0|nr:hypothetical protein [Aureimonas ureilytica]